MHAYNLAMIQRDRTGISCTVRVMVLVLIMRTFNVVNMQKQWETWLTNPGLSNNTRWQPNTPWWYPKTTWVSLNSRGGCHSLVRWKASTPWTWSSGAFRWFGGTPWAEGMFEPGQLVEYRWKWLGFSLNVSVPSWSIWTFIAFRNVSEFIWIHEMSLPSAEIVYMYIVMLNTTSAPLLLPFFPFPLGWPTHRFKKACLAKVRRQDAIRLDQL